MPDPATFAELAAAAILAGAVRGFSGFGAAMTFVPLASMFIHPAAAVVVIFLLDLVPAWAMVPGIARHCDWRDVLPLAIGAGLTIPVGAWLLVIADPIALRWAMPLLSLLAVGLLASGWRYGHRPGRALAGVVGAVAGFFGGLTSFYGPPIVLFWLGGPAGHVAVRSNLIVFFAFTSLVGGASYAANGLLTPDLVMLGAMLLPVYGLALLVGIRLFGRTSEANFRGFAYGLIAVAALVSLPLW